MWLKYIGIFLIIILSWFLGFAFSKNYIDRVEELKELEKLLNSMHDQISYILSPIPEVIHNLKFQIKYPLNDVLEEFEKNMMSRTMDINIAWKNALKANESKLCLNKEDIQLLEWFGNQLGLSDKDTQLKNIEFNIKQLQKSIAEAEMEKKKNCHLYRSMGISIGFFIAILLA